ncbi:type 1 glutamine amidotransferase domain-containing protein [Corallincola holothuriorum]|uniref:Type 1 glutamine amidotransferase domain-containing protein n=1 Tax=Corallincola holothuriorum TaxID=2282215 RepID=A0A368N411_9GAMM|nr:type 1 glutamine amidotransferase domain-containing protein [Corallincola holothuriorum]RCU45307.1 type 1 glutamine amidotransferase domain-containing protein [Corallincola holothuriorum]
MKLLIKSVLLAVLAFASTTSLAADKVLMVLTSHSQMGDTGKPTGYWLAELTHPYYALADAGFEVTIVSIKGGKAPIDPNSLTEEDAENQRFLADAKLKQQIENTATLASVNPADYRAVVYSGGHGTMWDFPNNPDVNSVSAAIYEQGGVVAAVCHGPAALLDTKLSDGSYLIAGKQVTGFSNLEEEQIELTQVMPFLLQDQLIERGASFSKAAPWQSKVVADQRVVTGQNPQSAKLLGETVAALLKK